MNEPSPTKNDSKSIKHPSDSDLYASRIGKKAGMYVYILLTCAATLWVFISVLAVHCGFSRTQPMVKGKQIDAKASNLKEIRHCHRQIESLLENLHRETLLIQTRALKFNTNPQAEWKNWSEAWRAKWNVIDHKCRLNELHGRDTHTTIDSLYDVHKELAKLERAYNGVMDRFIHHHVDRLVKLRNKLRVIRNTIEKKQLNHAPSTLGANN